MTFINHCLEGDRSKPGLNIIHVSDGGFALALWVWRIALYFRRRGPQNPAWPRHVLDWRIGPTHREAEEQHERFCRGELNSIKV